MEMMMAEKSLDKISHSLGINRKTTFDWCHKILSSLDQDEGKEFSGITKSEEAFFERFDKGYRHLGSKSLQTRWRSRRLGYIKEQSHIHCHRQ